LKRAGRLAAPKLSSEGGNNTLKSCCDLIYLPVKISVAELFYIGLYASLFEHFIK